MIDEADSQLILGYKVLQLPVLRALTTRSRPLLWAVLDLVAAPVDRRFVTNIAS